MTYDPAAQALGEAIGGMFRDIRNVREANRINQQFSDLENHANSLAKTARCAAALLGACEAALREIDPDHPVIRDGAHISYVQDVGMASPHRGYWPQEARDAGARVPVPARPKGAQPPTKARLQQLEADKARLEQQVASLQGQVAALNNQAKALQAQLEKSKLVIHPDRDADLMRMVVDLVHRRAQGAVLRRELERVAPDHPMVTDADLRQAVSKAAERSWAYVSASISEDDCVDVVTNPKSVSTLWKGVDDAALSSFDGRTLREKDKLQAIYARGDQARGGESVVLPPEMFTRIWR